MKLSIQRLRPEALLPARSYDGDAGFDLHAAEAALLEPGQRASVGTGIAIEIPAGHAGLVLPRSGLAARHGVTVLNTPGTVDADYRGEIQVILINFGDAPYVVQRGARIAQLVIAPVLHATLSEDQELAGSKRGSGGFGSTGTG